MFVFLFFSQLHCCELRPAGAGTSPWQSHLQAAAGRHCYRLRSFREFSIDGSPEARAERKMSGVFQRRGVLLQRERHPADTAFQQ